MSDASDSDRPSPAGVYDFFLGGSAYTDAERQQALTLLKVAPEIADAAEANRGFVRRAARWLAEQGIDQFLDLGSGLPTQENTHQVVSRVNAQARVVYVDSDPRVQTRSKELLREQGATTVRAITADLRNPREVLEHPDLRELIDLSRPVGILITAVLHFIADDEAAGRVVSAYTHPAAPGSCLALSHATAEGLPEESVQRVTDIYLRMGEAKTRGRVEFERLFADAGVDLVPIYPGGEPGIAHTGTWGAEDPEAADSEGSRWLYCGIGRKP